MVLTAVLLQVALSSPHPDEYQIPEVGNNRRSQFYVLHDDGTYKYGYDTGEDAFESQKLKSNGLVKGKFGYKNPEGENVKLEYTSGTGGFVARGSHIPEVHPDVTAAFAAARAAGPFKDPLAGTDGDRSFNFGFDGEEYKRNEVSNSDGTVTGSYSYVDENGVTKNYRYRAGKGIGFVIEGDDIPKQVKPFAEHTKFHADAVKSLTRGPTRTSSTKTHGSHSFSTGGSRSHTTQSHTSTRSKPTHSTRRKITKVSKPARTYTKPTKTYKKPAKTYFPPQVNTHSSTKNTRTHSSSSHSSSSRNQFAKKNPSTKRTFETANTRASQSPSGRYSVAYETSSHTRQESGDDDNNVRGSFTFETEDDGQQHSVNYEAGSSTGFIASGAHLPVGPSVPGAPSGQVTGRLVKSGVPFVDPLADGDLDKSFNFKFEGEEYSRTEDVDEDGTVTGTYSVLGEDNIRRTYRYRAGKGIGYEVEEIGSAPGQRKTVSSSSSSSGRKTYKQPSSTRKTSSGSSHKTSSSSSGSVRGSTSSHRTYGDRSTSTSHTRASSLGSGVHKNQRHSSSGRNTNQVFPGFKLRQYDASEGRGKFGYVLKFDD